MTAGLNVSVVIPAYNAEAFLAEAIESVLAQETRPGQVVVVDDGSTDATAEVATSFGKRVEVLSQANGGIGAARNAGIRHATGEFIALLDADDTWLPAKLRLQLECFASRPELGMVFTGVAQFRGTGAERLVESGSGAGVAPSALLARRSVFECIGLFSADVTLGEFIDWYARARDSGVMSHSIPEALVMRRLHDTNIGLRERDSRVDYARVLRAHLNRQREAGQE